MALVREGQKAPAFIIDGNGVVRRAFPMIRVDGHAEQVLDALSQR